MTLAEVWRILLRQWWVIVIGVLISGGLTALAYASVPPTYTSSSVVMLLQQKNSAVDGGENPYLIMDASLTVTGEALLRAVTDDQGTVEFVAGVDPAAVFSIVPVLNGPFLMTTTEAATEAEALTLQAGLRERLAAKLTELQTAAGAPAKLQIQLADVSDASKPEAVNGRKIQVVAGVAAAGLALTTSLAFLVDRLRARRARRRAAAGTGAAAAPEPDRRNKPVPVVPLPEPVSFLGEDRRGGNGFPRPEPSPAPVKPAAVKPAAVKPAAPQTVSVPRAPAGRPVAKAAEPKNAPKPAPNAAPRPTPPTQPPNGNGNGSKNDTAAPKPVRRSTDVGPGAGPGSGGAGGAGAKPPAGKKNGTGASSSPEVPAQLPPPGRDRR